MDLNKIMQMDHVIQVHADGSITEPDGIHGPEVTVETDDDGQYVATRNEQGRMTGWNVHVDGDGWTLLKGYAVDDGSELLHPSQFIGGALAEAILTTPGYYVATVVTDDSDEPGDSWCVAFKEATEVTRFTAETDQAHTAGNRLDWHKVWVGLNGIGEYVDIHKFGTFGDRDYTWVFVYTVGGEVAHSVDATDEESKLPEEELKRVAQSHAGVAHTKWRSAKHWAARIELMRSTDGH